MRLAERDVLRLRYSLFTTAADAASGRQRGVPMRSTRSEIKVITDLVVRGLHQGASEIARRTRELDAEGTEHS
jgi:hypothetical protein